LILPGCRFYDSGIINTNIRQATPIDAPVIVDFNLRLALETEKLRLDPEVVRAGVEALFRDPAKGVYYVAESSEGILGQVMITYEWSDWRNGNIWWLQSVYVRPEFRRQGVFAALFAHLRQLSAGNGGVSALRLYMHADNMRARTCYARLGMRETKYEVFEAALPGNRE